MNRLLQTLTLLAALAIAPAAAQAQVPGAGGFTSDKVKFVKNYPAHADTAGAVLHQGFYYITTERDLTIYDTTKDPENPVKTGSLTFTEPGQPVFTEEDPNTNGKILLVENGDTLMVIDVVDKAKPKVLSTLDGFSSHTTSCVLDCTWVYGSEGAIADLRDPAKPRLSEKTWPGTSSNHDVTEVKPGIVLTSTEPMLLLDARTDPENPTILATTQMPGFTHANLWPNQATDEMALVGGEATGPGCSEDKSATFQTWDTRNWETNKTFSLLGQFAMKTGVPAQGANFETTFCVHWFDPHPTYANGGFVPIAWYEHGVRFLQVGGDGKIAELGWYVPFNGQASDVDWVSNDVVYVADYIRGLDIIKWTGPIPQGRGRTMQPVTPGGTPGGSSGGSPTTPNQATPLPGAGTGKGGPSFDTFVSLPSSKRCAKAKGFKVKVRKAKDPVTKLELRVNGKKILTAKGKKLKKALKIKKLPRKKRFAVQVKVTTRSGYQSAGQRSYKGC